MTVVLNVNDEVYAANYGYDPSDPESYAIMSRDAEEYYAERVREADLGDSVDGRIVRAQAS